MQITHPLSAYRRKVGLSVDAFCQRLKISSAAYASYICGRRFPRPDVLGRVERVTGGEVTSRDFLLFVQAAVSPEPRSVSGGLTGEVAIEEPAISPAPLRMTRQMDLEELLKNGGLA